MNDSEHSKLRSYFKWLVNPSRTQFAILLVIPACVLALALAIYLFGYSFYLSLHDVNLARPWSSPFVGFGLYKELFSSSDFWRSMNYTLYFTVIGVSLQITLGIALAVLLNRKFRLQGFYRVAILVPWIIPQVIAAMIWAWILLDRGILNTVLTSIGILKEPYLWLGSVTMTKNIVIGVSTWREVPFLVLIFLAGLQTIPESMYEAARVDGATSWKQFWYITLPLLRPTLLVALLLRTMSAIKAFDLIYVLTSGGPANTTEVMGVYTYDQAFSFLRLGFASASAFVLVLIILIISVIYIKLLWRDVEY